MADKDAFAERRRAQEEEYFRKKDAELIEKMRRRSEADVTLRQLAEHTGIADEELLKDLQERGFSAALVRVLPLVPFIQVAWADGRVSDAERELILQQAIARGLAEGSEGYQQVTEWLTTRPDPQIFTSAMHLVQLMLAALPPDQRAASRADLLSYSTTIAAASGGLLGFGSISSEEGALLKRIASALERDHGDAIKDVLNDEAGLGWMP
jgi:tellurite resistance protein